VQVRTLLRHVRHRAWQHVHVHASHTVQQMLHICSPHFFFLITISTANSASFESISPLLGNGLMSEEGHGTFPLSSGDERFTAWLLRGARAIMYKVFVTDTVELWENVSVVRIVPFVSGFVLFTLWCAAVCAECCSVLQIYICDRLTKCGALQVCQPYSLFGVADLSRKKRNMEQSHGFHFRTRCLLHHWYVSSLSLSLSLSVSLCHVYVASLSYSLCHSHSLSHTHTLSLSLAVYLSASWVCVFPPSLSISHALSHTHALSRPLALSLFFSRSRSLSLCTMGMGLLSLSLSHICATLFFDRTLYDLFSVLQYVAACCSVLQYVAACCSVLQCFPFFNRAVYNLL